MSEKPVTLEQIWSLLNSIAMDVALIRAEVFPIEDEDDDYLPDTQLLEDEPLYKYCKHK